MEDKISLFDIIKVIKKKLVFIISVFIVMVSMTGIISYFFLTPIYEASTQILINQKQSDNQPLNTQDIQTNLQLINTYNDIIKSPLILSRVIDELNLQTTPELLAKEISVKSEQNSQVVDIIVEDPDLKKAVDIANSTTKIFQEEINILMKVDNVTILSPAINKKKINPIRPNIPINLAISGFLGLLIGVGITFLLEYLDTTIKTEQDISELIETPILGLISPISEKFYRRSKSGRKRGDG